MPTPIKRITLLYMRTIMTTSDNFKAKSIYSKGASNSMISKVCPTRCTAVHTFNKSSNPRYPWYLVMGFCSQDISEISVIPNAAQDESYSFMPCRMVHLQHFELWNCGNFGICSKNDPQGQHWML